MRDMTKAAYQAKLASYGFEATGFMGYYRLPKPHDHISVCSLNAGDRYRDRLAYLLDHLHRAERRAEA